MGNYRPESNLPFLGNILECEVLLQLQDYPDEPDYLDLFQSSFMPGFEMETTLIALVDDLRRDFHRGSLGPP